MELERAAAWIRAESERASAAGIERLNFSLLKRFCDGAAAEIRQGNKVGAAACVSAESCCFTSSPELDLLCVCVNMRRARRGPQSTRMAPASVSFPRHWFLFPLSRNHQTSSLLRAKLVGKGASLNWSRRKLPKNRPKLAAPTKSVGAYEISATPGRADWVLNAFRCAHPRFCRTREGQKEKDAKFGVFCSNFLSLTRIFYCLEI